MGKRRAWGAGSIYQRLSDSRWVVAVRHNGKRHVRYADSEREAKRMLTALRADVTTGAGVSARPRTVEVVIQEWLAYKKRSPKVSPTSYQRYFDIAKHLYGLHTLTMAELTEDAINRHLDTLSPATAEAVLSILRSAIDRAIAAGHVQRNVAKLAAAPKREVRAGVALRGSDVRLLLDKSADDPMRPLWALLTGSGLRLGEALGLRWSDLDITARTVRVEGSMRHQDARYRGSGPRLALNPPKTSAGRRTAPLAGFAARELDALPRDAVYVFHRHNGKPLNPSTVQRAFDAAVARAGLPKMRVHDCRHTAATLALAGGASLDDVKRMLGHSSIAITSDTYGHLVSERQQAIADALDEAVG